jgi:phosphohistidine phosphatase
LSLKYFVVVRIIVLLRHGESADKQVGQMDFDRVLTERGKNSIHQLGRHLRQENIFPDVMFSSTAVRSQQTARILASEMAKGDIECINSLYNGDDSEYFNVVLHSAGTIVIVGHNPAISFVAGKLCNNYAISFAPGQAAIIEIGANPSEPMSGKLLGLVGTMR